MNKDDIRAVVRTRKAMLDATERLEAARAVFDALSSMAAFTMADKVLIYNSLPDALSTREFIDRYAGTKHFYLPRVNGVNLDILPYDATRIAIGAFHIEEPQGDDTVSPDAIELVVVPAVAYDRSGNRVGRGKGFYDRLLAETRASKVGVAYDFQLVDEIESDSHDIPVDFVITESHHIIVRRR